MNHITPRNSITIKGKLPKRWEFLSIHIGVENAWKRLLLRIDTIAEHADALMNSNGIRASDAVDQAINDLVNNDKLEYVTGCYWKLTPTHRKAIVEWLHS